MLFLFFFQVVGFQTLQSLEKDRTSINLQITLLSVFITSLNAFFIVCIFYLVSKMYIFF